LIIGSQKFCFTTDSYVVSHFFPGGNIGSWRCMVLSRSFRLRGNRCISLRFILEEGFPVDLLDKIIKAMAEAALDAGVKMSPAIPRCFPWRSGRIFINTSALALSNIRDVINKKYSTG